MWWVPLATAAISAIAQERTNKSNRAEAKRQMEFQEQQTSSAYQRAMSDMSAAGLNPMLSSKLGGAQSGQGAMAQSENVATAASSSAAQAMGVLSGFQQMRQSAALTQQAEAQTAKIKSETVDNQLNTAKRLQEIEALRQGANLSFQRQLHTAAQEALARTVNNIKEVELDVANTSFSADVARRKYESDIKGQEAILKGLEIPRGKAEAKFYGSDFGGDMPGVRALLEMVRGFSSAFGTRR